MPGVINDVVAVPPARTEPPDAAKYQSIVVPPGLVEDNATVPVPHLCPFTGLVGATGNELIVAITAVLVADKQEEVEFLASA